MAPQINHQPSDLTHLLAGPVCRTLRGCRERVRTMSLRQRWLLAAMWRLDVTDWDYEDQMARRLFEPFRRRPGPLVTKRRAVDRVDLMGGLEAYENLCGH